MQKKTMLFGTVTHVTFLCGASDGHREETFS